MKKDKKIKKVKSEKEIKLRDKFREQADKKNNYDCEKILTELNQASLDGEYAKFLTLKINQAHYLETLGLTVTADKIGYYKISWE